MRDLEAVALAFDRACRECKVNYAFVGGIAVIAWGQPRLTMDADALVDVVPSQTARLAKALAGEKLKVTVADLEDGIREGSHVTVHDSLSGFHVDLKPAKTSTERAEIEYASEIVYGEGRLRVVGPEDTIAFKLLFGSPQDLGDARSILVRQEARIRWSHLEQACRRLRVSAKLKTALIEAGIRRPDK